MKPYLKLMRVHHYIKNVLVFAALACSGQLFSSGKFLLNLAGFAAFCLVSSIVYIINDIRDSEKDRMHPVKCKRPIASGAVSTGNASILAAILAAAAAGLSVWIGDPMAGLILAVYLLINIAYSNGLKDVPLLDIVILVSGFLLRVLYGSIVSDIVISNWLYLTVLVLAMYLSLGKRRNELKQLGGGKTRKVLKAYPIGFLEQGMTMCLTLTNVFYTLWAMDDATAERYSSGRMVMTVPIVLLITMKYSMDVEGASDGDPVEVVLHDAVLLALCIIYLAAMMMILYA